MAARAAEGAGRTAAAAAGFARALDAAPDDAAVAIRAYRAAIVGGDGALVRRAAAILTRAGVAPSDAALFAIADAARAGDATALRRATMTLRAQRLGILAPILDAWTAGGMAGVAALDAAKVDLVARPFVAENRALLLIAAGRHADGATATAMIAAGRSRPGIRAAAAALLVGAGQPDRAQTLVGTDTPLPAGERPTLAFAVSRLFARLSEELGGARASDVGLALARAALDADPGYDRARLVLASQLARAGETDAALAALPTDGGLVAETLSARIALLDDAGRPAEALAAARIRTATPGATALDDARLADLLMTADHPAEAAPLYAKLLKDPETATGWAMWLRYGSALDAAGRWKDARRALRRAVALGPDQPQALNQLGYGLVERGEDMSTATRLLERAHALEPADPAIADSLGWAYHRGGDTARALPLLERAAEDSPADPDIAEHLGDVYAALGRRFEARYAWRAAALTAEPETATRLETKIAR